MIPRVTLDAWRAERPYALPFTLVNRTLLEDALAQAHRRVDDVHEAELQLWRQRQYPLLYMHTYAIRQISSQMEFG